MKNLVKLVTVNDGKEKEHYNGNWLFVENQPRSEKIIAAFLNDGWKLESFSHLYNPAINKPGTYSFYRGGCSLLFTKAVEDDAKDNGDELLKNVLSELDNGESDQDGEEYGGDDDEDFGDEEYDDGDYDDEEYDEEDDDEENEDGEDDDEEDDGGDDLDDIDYFELGNLED